MKPLPSFAPTLPGALGVVDTTRAGAVWDVRAFGAGPDGTLALPAAAGDLTSPCGSSSP
jgi:hypothetical protein